MLYTQTPLLLSWRGPVCNSWWVNTTTLFHLQSASVRERVTGPAFCLSTSYHYSCQPLRKKSKFRNLKSWVFFQIQLVPFDILNINDTLSINAGTCNKILWKIDHQNWIKFLYSLTLFSWTSDMSLEVQTTVSWYEFQLKNVSNPCISWCFSWHIKTYHSPLYNYC